MLDTIRLYSPAFTSHYKGWINLMMFNYHKTTKGDLIYFNTFYNEEGKASINIKYDAKRDYLVITFSIPKLLYGNSLREFGFTKNEISLLLKTLQDRTSDYIKINFLEMRVSRIDIAVNIETTFNLGSYLRALGFCAKISKKYKIQEFKNTSLIISNNSKRISFYDKEAEQLKSKELDRGYKKTGKILRFEIQLKNTNTIRKELKLGKGVYLTFYDVLNYPEIFANYLPDALKKLIKGYGGNSELNEFQSDLVIINELAKKCKKNVIPMFLILKHGFDKKYLETLFSHAGISDRSIDYFDKKIKEFGLINLDKKNINLIKEISQKLENKVCKFQN